MSVKVINTKAGIQIAILGVKTEDHCPVSRWNGQPITNLTNEELTLLWFKLDKHLDTECLQDIYVEMSMRGIPRILPEGA